MFQLYTQYLPCSFQCIIYKGTRRMVNLYQRQRHAGTWKQRHADTFIASAVEMSPSLFLAVALFRSKLQRQTIITRLYPTFRSHALS